MPRLNFIDVAAGHPPDLFANVVIQGLSLPQKTLPCRYFYDNIGSELFERICRLPEYYLTRTEQQIFEARAEEIVATAGEEMTLVEFGSGSSCKTRILIEALLARQRRLHYMPIDISRDFLRASALSLLEDYDRLAVTALAAEYNDGIQALPTADGARLILFLGSNIGNFEPKEAIAFLARIRARMQPHDRLLVGVDLVKDHALLWAAYNDSMGVTEAFNKNLLARINTELDADFDLDAFHHAAPFVEEKARIEMRLVSRCRQTVTLAAVDRKFRFEAGEYLHTENSHKYTRARFADLCARAGLELQACWTDPRDWFAVILLRPAQTPGR